MKPAKHLNAYYCRAARRAYYSRKQSDGRYWFGEPKGYPADLYYDFGVIRCDSEAEWDRIRRYDKGHKKPHIAPSILGNISGHDGSLFPRPFVVVGLMQVIEMGASKDEIAAAVELMTKNREASVRRSPRLGAPAS
jgi:hypothetical protein